MSAIEASSVKVATMADGTLRITADIEPRHAQAAFALFGAPGTSMALAALHPIKLSTEPEPDKPKGGELAKLAGMWCEDAAFQRWLAAAHPMLQPGEDREDIPNAAKDTASALREICGIDSRAELDHDAVAAERFQAFVRLPYMRYLKS